MQVTERQMKRGRKSDLKLPCQGLSDPGYSSWSPLLMSQYIWEGGEYWGRGGNSKCVQMFVQQSIWTVRKQHSLNV